MNPKIEATFGEWLLAWVFWAVVWWGVGYCCRYWDETKDQDKKDGE